MPARQDSEQRLVNRDVVKAGAVLIAAGTVTTMAGAAVCLSAVAAGLRRHVQASELPPSELALHHWRRAKSAVRVGADTWRTQVPRQMTRETASRTPVA
jgi:hypothetical protein